MANITVTKKFNLNRDGKLESFDIGVHEVSDEDAAHWYVQAHCASADEVESAEVEQPKSRKKAD